jgi:beta-lactamase superfamily II metal-dependent hydrolase
MLAIEMLQAGHGDALIVEYGSGTDMHRLLIDAGTVHAYDNVRARLLQRRDSHYEVFVVTHVDEDHIGGAISLLEDQDLRRRIDHVWFNGYMHSKRGGDVLGPVDGERLTHTIVKRDYKWNHPFTDWISENVGGPIVVTSEGDLPTFTLSGGATVYLLSPTGRKLKRMAKVWEDVIVDAGLVPGEGTDRGGRAPKSYRKKVAVLPEVISEIELGALAKATTPDSSAANGSSIAFILEYDGARALLAADAHPAVLVSGLKRFARMKGEARVRIDLCKLPHHGSRANVTAELLQAVETSCYLISTDGMTFGHPDDAALARVLQASPSARIYCNYASERITGWVARARQFGASMVMPEPGSNAMRVEAQRSTGAPSGGY